MPFAADSGCDIFAGAKQRTLEAGMQPNKFSPLPIPMAKVNQESNLTSGGRILIYFTVKATALRHDSLGDLDWLGTLRTSY